MPKVVKIEGKRYMIYNEDDLIFLTHLLASKGYEVEEIAQMLRISKRRVIRYLEDCW